MKKARNILWILFFVSVLVLVAILPPRGNTPTGTPNPEVPPSEIPLVVWIPLITALVSLAGALTTTVFNLRHDRLESQKIQLEVTKLQLEIDQLKNKSDTRQAGIGPDQDPDI